MLNQATANNKAFLGKKPLGQRKFCKVYVGRITETITRQKPLII